MNKVAKFLLLPVALTTFIFLATLCNKDKSNIPAGNMGALENLASNNASGTIPLPIFDDAASPMAIDCNTPKKRMCAAPAQTGTTFNSATALPDNLVPIPYQLIFKPI